MASVSAFIRTSKIKSEKVNIRFRLRDGRNIQLFHVSEYTINPEIWDSKKQGIKDRIVIDAVYKRILNKNIADRKDLILNVYESNNITTSKQFEEAISNVLYPIDKRLDESFFDLFTTFLNGRKLSEVRIRNFKVLFRILKRFELYKKKVDNPNFQLNLETFNLDILREIDSFIREEHNFVSTYPDLYLSISEKRLPKERGLNTINGLLVKLRTFIIWCEDNGKINHNPFNKYSIPEAVYGTPYYINIEERNKIYRTNLSRHPNLEIQRDIFIFQCLIGCRVSDLYKFTHLNVINHAIEYIPRKTREGRPLTIRVPLNTIAKEILDKYYNKDGPLFPFIPEQKYNKAIKRIFLAARITRPVMVLNTVTREQEIRPINEIASSHLARRCFVGNLYKQVKDPNLVSALSGHKEGSKAFARYRDIDEDMKKELVKMLE